MEFANSSREYNFFVDVIAASTINWWQFLLMLNVVVFLMGLFLSPGAIILIAVPIILPVARMKRKE